MELRRQFGDRLETRLIGRGTTIGVGPLFAMGLLIAALPILCTGVPPLFDYPNHLARMRILADGGVTLAGGGWVRPHWSYLPNLAEDLIVPALASLMPLEAAGRVFLVVILALSASGAMALNRALTGTWNRSPLLAFLFLYHRSYLWGFLNYDFGLGVALWAGAAWLLLERLPRMRWLAATLFALAGYFSHIEALGCQALLVGGLEWSPLVAALRRRDIAALTRRIATLVLVFAPPAVLLLAGWHPGAAASSPGFGSLLRKPDLLFSVFDNYSRPFDIVCFVTVLVTLACLLWRRQPVAVRLVPALLLLSAMFVIVPPQLFSGSGVDHRLPPMIFLVLAAGLRPPAGAAGRWLALGATALFAVRMAVILVVWTAAGRIYASDLAILDQVPAGSAVAVAYPARAINLTAVPLAHLPLMATVRREAFVAPLFAYPDQQPLALSGDLATLLPLVEPTLLWQALLDGQGARSIPPPFDYLVALDRSALAFGDLPCLRPVAAARDFALYRIDRGHCAVSP